MEIASNEKVLKTYDYACLGKANSTLTVTDKRVIVSTEGKKPNGVKICSTDEIMIDSIEKVSSGVVSKRTPALLVFAIIFAIAGAALYLSLKLGEMNLYILSGLEALALIFLICFIAKRKVGFYLILTTNQYEGMGLSTSLNTWFSKEKAKKKIKVHIKKHVASQIVEEIGALIVESKYKVNE